MSKRRRASKAPGALTAFQAFSVERVHREAIHGAPYNPRKISRYARDALQRSLRERGLLGPITCNRRSEAQGWPAGSPLTIVGGHQRLAALDALEGRGDYLLDVAVIDVAAEEERVDNVLLNNAMVGGDWDLAALADMAKGPDAIDLQDAGFDAMTIAATFEGDPELSALFQLEAQPPEVQHQVSELEEAKAAGKRAKAKRKAEEDAAPKAEPEVWILPALQRFRAKMADLHDAGFYTVLVFRDRAAAEAFNARLGLAPDEQVFDGARVMAELGD